MDMAKSVFLRARTASILMKRLSGKYMLLAGRMLDAFLAHSVAFDASILDAIALAVKDRTTNEPAHEQIILDLENAITKHFAANKTEPTPEQLEQICKKTIADFTMEAPNDPDPTARAKPYFHGDLQAVIGSVQALEFVSCHKISLADGVYRFSCTYAIIDVYDFTNGRKHMPAYDDYRNDLAFLMHRDISHNNLFASSLFKFDLDLAYALVNGNTADGLSPTLVCASLLYAAQLNGLYAGIPWKADIEDEIEINKPSLIRTSDDIKLSPTSKTSLPKAREKTKAYPYKPRKMIPHRLSPRARSPIYIVKPGDTLSHIAKGLLGDAKQWPAIFEVNKQALGQNPNLIRPGQRLIIPLPGLDARV